MHTLRFSRRLLGLSLTLLAALLPRALAAQTPPQDVPPALQPPTAPSANTFHVSPFAPNQPANVGLRIAAAPALKLAAPNDARYDFGQASVLDQRLVEQDFVLRNEAKSALALQRLEPSCGCTTATVQPSENGALPTLQPGQQVTVHVTVNLAALAPGPLHKSVMVYVHGDFRPVAVLQVTGTLLPCVTFTPRLLNFGKVRFGTQPSQTITVTLDTRLAPTGGLPTLVCSNPAIHVRLLAEQPAPAAKADAERPGAHSTRTGSYAVSLPPDLPLGSLVGTLSVSDPSHPMNQSMTATLVGEVIGDLAAEPQACMFAVVPEGKAVTRQILLTGRPTADMEKLTLSSDNSSVTLHLLPAPAAVDTHKTRLLEITLTPRGRLGLFQTQVTVTLSNGQRLVLPVMAYVQPKQPAQ